MVDLSAWQADRHLQDILLPSDPPFETAHGLLALLHPPLPCLTRPLQTDKDKAWTFGKSLNKKT